MLMCGKEDVAARGHKLLASNSTLQYAVTNQFACHVTCLILQPCQTELITSARLELLQPMQCVRPITTSNQLPNGFIKTRSHLSETVLLQLNLILSSALSFLPSKNQNHTGIV